MCWQFFFNIYHCAVLFRITILFLLVLFKGARPSSGMDFFAILFCSCIVLCSLLTSLHKQISVSSPHTETRELSLSLSFSLSNSNVLLTGVITLALVFFSFHSKQINKLCSQFRKHNFMEVSSHSICVSDKVFTQKFH